jgi:hypothetical protein
MLEACGNFHRLVRRSSQITRPILAEGSHFVPESAGSVRPSKGIRLANHAVRKQSAAAGDDFWRKGNQPEIAVVS